LDPTASLAAGLIRSEDHLIFKTDADLLVPAASLLWLDGHELREEAWLALGKRLPPSGTPFPASDDLPAKLAFVRQIADLAKADQKLDPFLSQRSAHLYLTAPVPGPVQYSRRIYRLSAFASVDSWGRAIMVYRALLKRNPSTVEAADMAALSLTDFLATVRALATTAPHVKLINDIPDTNAWMTTAERITSLLMAEVEATPREATGDNLALLRKVHLSRSLPGINITV
ncbi:MAG: hypothetical protein B7X10_04360, partial [Burkholderiales bacterium 21-58-4]